MADLADTDDHLRRDLLWLAMIIIAGFVLRLLTSRGDLWLDEILSVNIARSIQTPLDILLSPEAHKDNNHPLNTLWLWLVESHNSFLLDRLLSVLTGTASIALAWMFARRWGRAAGLIAAILIAGSFFMIHYGSEARGYSMLVMFTLLALIALDNGMRSDTWLNRVSFWIACILGLLSQLAFVHTLLALFIWIGWRIVSRRSGALHTVVHAIFYFAPPALFSAWIYWVFVTGLKVAGANVTSYRSVVADTAEYILGVPQPSTIGVPALMTVVGLLAGAILLLIRRRNDAWVVLLMLVVGAPAITVAILQPLFLLPRYFTVSITSALLLFSFLLGAFWERGAIGRLSVSGLIAVFLTINGWNTTRSLKDGRGQYLRAMRDIAGHHEGQQIAISGDHDFRESTLVDFYAPMISGKAIEYVPQDRMKDVHIDAVVCHSFDIVATPPSPIISDAAGRPYALAGTYRTGPLSGWFWLVYLRKE